MPGHLALKVNKRIELAILGNKINKDFIKISLQIYQMAMTLNRQSEQVNSKRVDNCETGGNKWKRV